MYDLQQALPCWFSKFCIVLTRYSFKHSYVDYSLFTYSFQDHFICVIIYVDEIIITGNNSLDIARFTAHLSQFFHMKDLGPLKYFLGIEVAQNASRLYLSQWNYALDIISETRLSGSKLASD